MNIIKSNYQLLIYFLISTFVFSTVFMSILFKSTLLHFLDILSFHWFLVNFGEPKMNYSHGWFNDYMTIAATYGDIITFIFITIIVSVIAIFKRQFIFSVWNLFTVATGGILGILLKKLIHRARPYDHLTSDSGFSFPSGHSLASTLVIFMLLFILIPKLKNKILKTSISILLLLIWVSILFSRLYFHAHYLSDVLGGVTFSLAWLLLSTSIYRNFISKLDNRNVNL